VNPALAVVAAIAVAGGVIAVSAREPRGTVLGLLIVFLAAPLIGAPWPGPVPILARVAAALLAARLLAIGVRGEAEGAGTGIGWPAEALAAIAAGIVGYGSHGLGATGLGQPESQAAGFALAALAIAPLVNGRDVVRLGAGSILVVQAALLVRQSLDGTPSDGEQLVIALLTVALGGAVAVIATAAGAAGGLAVSDDGTVAVRRLEAREARRPTADARGTARWRLPANASDAQVGDARAGTER
jgi:hypothetical protein